MKLGNKIKIPLLFVLVMNSLFTTTSTAQEHPINQEFEMILAGPKKTIIVAAAAFPGNIDKFPLYNEYIRVERADRGSRNFKRLADISFPKSAIELEKNLGGMMDDIKNKMGVQRTEEVYDRLLKEGPAVLGILLINPDLQEALGLTFTDHNRDPDKVSTYRLTKIIAAREVQQRIVEIPSGLPTYPEQYTIASISPSDSIVSMSWLSTTASKKSPFPLIARVYKQGAHNQGFKEQGRTLVTGSSILSDSTFVYHSDVVEPGRNLAYYIQIEDFAGNIGLPSDTVYTVSVSKGTIKPVMNLQARDTLGGILLTWDSIPDDALYAGIQILKSRKVSEDYIVLDTIPAEERTFFDDRVVGSSVYYYRVRPLLFDLPLADPMQFAETTGYVGHRDSTIPNIPTQVSAEVVKQGVRLKWQQGEELNLFGYYILRGTSRKDMAVISSAVQAHTFLDTSIAPGFSGQLQYALQAISLNQQVSDTSEIVSVSVQRPVNLSPPGGLEARWADDAIVLNWDDVIQRDDKVDGYMLYRKKSDGEEFVPMMKTIHTLPFFTDTTVQTSESYIYAVASLDSWGNHSILSPTSAVKPTRLQTILLPQELYLRNLNMGIEIFWPEVSFLPNEQYILYRKMIGQSNYIRIASVYPDKPYVDYDVRSDQLYDYQIKIKSSEGEGKAAISKTIRRF